MKGVDLLTTRCKECLKSIGREKRKNPETKILVEFKFCLGCHRNLPANLETFNMDRAQPDDFHIYCKKCRKDQAKELRLKEKQKWNDDDLVFYKGEYIKYREMSSKRDRQRCLSSKYKISLKDYESTLTAQNNKCAICGLDNEELIAQIGKTMSVDHCHTEKKVRGLLCTNCNFGLGNFKDSVIIMEKAIACILNPPGVVKASK